MKNLCLALAALVAACTPAPVEPDDLDPANDVGACQIVCSPVQYGDWVDGVMPTVSTSWGQPDASCVDPVDGFLSSCTEVRGVKCSECAALARTTECPGDVYALDQLILTGQPSTVTAAICE